MDISKVENYLALTIGKSVLKEAVGDGYEFELIYEALLQNMESDDSIIDSLNSTNESDSNVYNALQSISAGQNIEDIPLKIRQAIINSQSNLDEDYINSISNDNNLLSLIQESNLGAEDGEKITEAVNKYSEIYGVDKSLILAIIKQESNFDKNAVSEAGAKGLMQLMDFNLESYGVSNPYDIEENIEAGVKHIKYCLDKFNGNVEMALMAYNAGEGTMERRGVTSSEDLYKMPEETQNYVNKIMNNI